jgi:hypothetical protein
MRISRPDNTFKCEFQEERLDFNPRRMTRQNGTNQAKCGFKRATAGTICLLKFPFQSAVLKIIISLSYRHGHEATVFEPNALMHKSVGPT